MFTHSSQIQSSNSMSRSRSWSGSWSRSRSRSRSWSRSGSGSRSRSRSWSGSGASLPPNITRIFQWAADPIGGTARRFNEFGWPIEPLLDSLQEHGPMIQFTVGEKYYIETFGKFYVGEVTEVTALEVSFKNASWVADTGKYSDFMNTGKSAQMEVEPIGDVTLPVAYISMKKAWNHKLFKEVI